MRLFTQYFYSRLSLFAVSSSSSRSLAYNILFSLSIIEAPLLLKEDSSDVIRHNNNTLAHAAFGRARDSLSCNGKVPSQQSLGRYRDDHQRELTSMNKRQSGAMEKGSAQARHDWTKKKRCV
jgi:hypothetical protein